MYIYTYNIHIFIHIHIAKLNSNLPMKPFFHETAQMTSNFNTLCTIKQKKAVA